jgi:hypothetical protein
MNGERGRIRGELAIGRGTSRHTLVFGGSDADPDHDAVIRIGGEAPGRRAHSKPRRARPCPTSGFRHLGSSSAVRQHWRTAETSCSRVPSRGRAKDQA